MDVVPRRQSLERAYLSSASGWAELERCPGGVDGGLCAAYEGGEY